MVRLGIGGLALALLALAPTRVAATVELTPEQHRRAVALYGELKCPVCKSQSVAASTSFLSEEMKIQIQEMIASGRTDAEIVDYYVQRYGEWILMRPPASGRGLLVWAVPACLVALAAAGLWLRLRRWSSAEPEGDPERNVPVAGIPADRAEKIRNLVEG